MAQSPAPDMHSLAALSPLDGRYNAKVASLRPLLSEMGFMHHRVQAEVAWLKALGALPAQGVREFVAFDAADVAELDRWVAEFSLADAEAIKAHEAVTNHDVKAVEYFLKDKAIGSGRPALKAAVEMIHFACTSEDINNTAHALMLSRARREVLQPAMQSLVDVLGTMAQAQAQQPMLSRTHGQTASPTTLGKELANVRARLRAARDAFAQVQALAKLNGAVGNFNAHIASVPEADWPELSRRVIEGLGLVQNPMTIQIEPHDWIAAYCNALAQFNVILRDLCQDVWGYVSLGYFKQRLKAGEVGSSTMPHKVNPIDFENAEGNLGLANAVLRHLAEKLPVSRWQRDLTDSTVLRNLGLGLGHSLLAYESTLKGLGKLEVNPARLVEDLDNAWEVLAEPIQTVMRRYGLPQPYEQLKALTRGRGMMAETMREFIAGLDLPAEPKARLLAMSPQSYVGLAESLVAAELRHP